MHGRVEKLPDILQEMQENQLPKSILQRESLYFIAY